MSRHRGPLLATERLCVNYGRFRALSNVSISLYEGEIVSIIGANGAGKSSLMKAIVGHAPGISGDVVLADVSLVGKHTSDIVKSGVSLIPEGRRLFASLSVEENLKIGIAVGRPGPFRLSDVYRLFPVLEEKRRDKARSLSGGQQQMVAIGRSLLTNPRVLLCDEISLGLAPVVIEQIYKVIPEIRSQGMSIALVEQDLTRSLAVADRFYCLLEGRISLEGAPADSTQETVTRAYFGSA